MRNSGYPGALTSESRAEQVIADGFGDFLCIFRRCTYHQVVVPYPEGLIDRERRFGLIVLCQALMRVAELWVSLRATTEQGGKNQNNKM